MNRSGHTIAWWEAIGVLALVGAAFAAVSLIEPAATPRSQTQAQKPPVDIEGCVMSDDGFRTENGVSGFKVVLTNTCEVRIRCVVYVNVINSRGANTGQQTMLLGAASPGQSSQKAWMFDTGYAGGMASMSRQCQGV